MKRDTAMTTRHRLAVIVAAVATLFAQSALADINIGVSTTLSGPAASLGVPVRNALALWPTEIAGDKIVLHILDDAAQR